MRWMMISISLICLICPVALGSISVEPPQFDIKLVAGDTVTKNITIRWDGLDEALVNIVTSIKPDDEGINITYNVEQPFLLDEEEKSITMTIKTDMALAPDTYTIKTIFYALGEGEEPECETKTIVKEVTKTIVDSGCLDDLNNLRTRYDVLSGNYDALLDELEGLRENMLGLWKDNNRYKEDNDDLRERLSTFEDDFYKYLTAGLMIIFALLFIIALILFITRRKVGGGANNIVRRT